MGTLTPNDYTMNEDAFARLVAEEVKNKVPDSQRDYLRLPENWTRWQRALLALIENLNNQLDGLAEAEKDAVARYEGFGDDGLKLLTESTVEYDNRRKKITRFKFHVENRLDEVTRMIALDSDAVDERLKTVELLRRAIERHREMLDEYEMDVSLIDEALWAVLEGRWEFDTLDLNAL